jgi:HK97 family phage prohead protease
MTRDFVLKLKGAPDDSGAFEGLASPYGDPPDLMGDVIEPGAYRQSIAQQGKGYPLLWAHQDDSPLGLARVEDSKAGLLVHGSLVMEDPAAVKALAHLRKGSVRGISIGYQIPKGADKVAYRDDGARVLKEVHLFEISLCAIAAAPRAQVTSVKSLGDVRHVLPSMRGGVKADDRAALLEIKTALKDLLGDGGLCECECPECEAGDCAGCSDPDCDDENCEGTTKAATLRELRSFAGVLKKIAA